VSSNNSPGNGSSGARDDDLLVVRAQQQVQALAALSDDVPLAAAGQAAADDSHRMLPDSFAGYRVLKEIHRGGQGVIYQALQESTKRKVAIKVMREGPFAGPGDRARFDREISILSQLNHPNIVAIHDTGQVTGVHYFVMDYVRGQPLDVYMAGGKRTVAETLRLFAKICHAVNAAHLRGVIHRDLKPGNIRIDENGEPHVLDFGLAKVAATDTEASAMTMTGQFVGSLPWAAPEQAEGLPSKIDTRTDVYALGVILYQMLTSKLPYEVGGNIRDVLDRIMRAEPTRPRTLRREIDDEVETIVLKCLQKERERRYQTAGEVARDVERYLRGEPIDAKRDSHGYLLKKTLRRYRVPFAVVGGFVLMTILGGIALGLQAAQLARERDRAVAAREEAKRARDDAKTALAKEEEQRKLAESFGASFALMRNAQTMVCDMSIEVAVGVDGKAPDAASFHTSRYRVQMLLKEKDSAVRMESLTGDEPAVSIECSEGVFQRSADGRWAKLDTEDPFDPARQARWWRKLMEVRRTPDRSLGEQEIDGQRLIGCEVAGWRVDEGARADLAMGSVYRIWVNPATDWPARVEREFALADLRMNLRSVWENIEWNVPLDTQAFQPPPVAEPLKLALHGTEEGLLDGLRAYAAASQRVTGELLARERELRDDQEGQAARLGIEGFREFLHGYPKDLDWSPGASAVLRFSIIAPNVSRSIVLAARASGDAEAIARAEEEAKKFLEELVNDVGPKLGQATLFYGSLLREGREPEYFGATVKPGDSESVLMRWRLDDGSFRVIYGDLRAETVPSDQPPPGEEALLDGLRAYAAEIERIKATAFGGRFADLPLLIEQRLQEVPDDPEAKQNCAFLSGVVDLLGRGYPSRLDASCLLQVSIIGPSLERAQELAARAWGDADGLARQAIEREAAAGDAEVAARLAERRDATRKEQKKLTRQVSAMLTFYRQLLVEDRELEYFGATVEPGDPDAVLLRWKLDDGSFRVIYGDLRVETLTLEEGPTDTP
jgi:predicted Ser/Thr protein kinase